MNMQNNIPKPRQLMNKNDFGIYGQIEENDDELIESFKGGLQPLSHEGNRMQFISDIIGSKAKDERNSSNFTLGLSKRYSFVLVSLKLTQDYFIRL